MKHINHYLGNVILGPPAFVKLLFRSLRLWWEFRLLRRQNLAISLCREPVPQELKRQRVLAVVTHVVSEQEAQAGAGAQSKLERLIRTIDSALISFAHCDLEIILNTCPRRHLVEALPEYIRCNVNVIEQMETDPMYIEFLVPDIFYARRENFDWFLFLEDDTLLHDSYAIEKLILFNRATGDPSLLLTPHRFEMLEGKKYYIDLLWWPDFKIWKECDWNRFATFSVNGIKFGECNRPHSAFFCLNREQIELWERSGRRWKNNIVAIGPLESAATYCLYEVFTLYKPHRDNLHFFEVQHWDTKYARMIDAKEKCQK